MIVPHLHDVAGCAVTLPEDLVTLLGQVRERLDRLWLQDDAARGYAVVLRSYGELQAIVAESGPEAARALAREQEESMLAVAEALGTTEEAARARLLHYEYLGR
ncbi:hypothetical protein [Streptomyces cinereoruber]|uniref:hypothetical protein n=1 Tax=Streptomyces cinereoruber TaxID=67260 RepID=UPI003C2EF422